VVRAATLVVHLRCADLTNSRRARHISAALMRFRYSLDFIPTVVALLAVVSFARSQPIVGGLAGKGSDNELLRGRVLLTELNCTACHGAPTQQAHLRAKGAPVLKGAGDRVAADFLRRFIADPHGVKPGTTMPAVLGHLSKAERNRKALAISHYLSSGVESGKSAGLTSPGSVAKGRELYSTVGCVACHGFKTDSMGLIPLGPLAKKYSLNSLVKVLKDPLRHRPSGRMPDSNLSHFEAVDIATYLIGVGSEEEFTVKPSLASEGERLFGQLGCAQCHSDESSSEPARAYPALRTVRPARGCLSGEPGDWPDFRLSADQVKELRKALAALDAQLTVDDQINLRISQLNCVACHVRGELGGPSKNLAAHFKGVDPNLGDQGRIPPPLTGVGAKLQPEWLGKVVAMGESARSYLKTRMPGFGATNVVDLIRLFGEKDSSEALDFDRVRDPKIAKEQGRVLAGNRGLNCVACHTFRLESAAPIRALDLTTMTDRLQENWFHRYMRNPQHYQPLTIMPNFWPGGKATQSKVLDGNTGQQIDALWQYLSYGRNVRAPSGVVLEPLPLVVGHEAVMLRRNFPGIGKRGISVGYPQGINLSFDAGQMRLASIWRGDFIEASPAWRGQGSGAVRILGSDTIQFPTGPAFGLLQDSRSPWPTNQQRQLPDFQFKGYSLDEQQRPTFAYVFKGVGITDRFSDRKDAKGRPYFERIVTLDRSDVGLYFRVAQDRSLRQLDDSTVQVGRKLRIRLPGESLIRGTELLFEMRGQNVFKFEYHW
jgi:mono/diheme cytochrome c family protein